MTVKAPLLANETDRMSRLRALAVLDTKPEPLFDTLARLAAHVCGTPIAMVCLIDEQRQWFKSRVGLEVSQTPRDIAFCAHTILADELMEVPDATQDPRFKANPLVLEDPHIRFYAAFPVVMPSGERVGTLCVIDRQPRQLNDEQKQLLKELTQSVTQALLMREQTLNTALTLRSAMEQELVQESKALGSVLDLLPAAIGVWDDKLVNVYANAAHEAWFGLSPENLLGMDLLSVVGQDALAAVSAFVPKALEGQAQVFDLQLTLTKGVRQTQVQLLPYRRASEVVSGVVLLFNDVTAERALHEAQEQLASMVKNSGDAILRLNLQGEIQHWNDSAERLFGYTAAEVLGRPKTFLIPLERLPELQRVHECIASGQSVPAFDTVRRHKDGRDMDISLGVSPIHDALGRVSGVAVLMRDISKRKAVERALRASQEMLDRTGHIAQVGGWSLDLRTQELTWSDETCRLHDVPPGYRPTLEEALSFYRDDAALKIEQLVNEALKTGHPWDSELPSTTARGRPIWVRAQGEVDMVDGQVVRLFGTVQDITSRRMAEIALQESQQMLRVLYESTPAMLYSMDVQGKLLTVSDVWLSKLGYQREDVIGCAATDFLAPVSRQKVRDHIFPALLKNDKIRDVPLRMVCRNGGMLDVLMSAVLDRDPQGQVRRALVFIDDVTQELASKAQWRHEHDLRLQVERHARELDQLLAERSEMLDVLAHEVRQPLNNASAALQSASAVLLGVGDDAVLPKLARAQSVMNQVLAGIDNTLAAATLLAGAGPLEQADTDIDTLIAVAVADLPLNSRSRIKVQRDTPTRTATMDMSLMRLALRNLLGNALKYSPASAEVVLRVIDSDEPLALILEVFDSGPGFEPDLLPRLFARGARGQQSQSGHGLGLYIARRVMEMHHGRVELSRNTPQGSTLRLVIEQSRA